MINVAGYTHATKLFRMELTACKIDTVPVLAPEDEVQCAVEGVGTLPGGFTLRVVRRWCYAVVSITPALPTDLAVEVSARPFAGSGSTYSGPDGLLGSYARAMGYAGGLFGDRLRAVAQAGVEHWHVDTVEALGAFIQALQEVLGAHRLTAVVALAVQCRAHTACWLAELSPYLTGDGFLSRCARDRLHSDPLLDADNVQVVALRAQYPQVVQDEPIPPIL